MDEISALAGRVREIYEKIEETKNLLDGRARIAVVVDDHTVRIGSEEYPSEAATDVYMRPGEQVWVQLVAGGHYAVVIGGMP